MRILLFAAPFAFAFAFVRGYLLQEHPRGWAGIAFLALLAVASAGVALFVPSARIRLWGAVNLCAAVICAYGMLDNVFHHNAYSGYAALVLVPIAALCALSMLVCAAVATPT